MIRKTLVMLLCSTVLAAVAPATPALAAEPPGGKTNSLAVAGRFTNYISQSGAGIHTCPSNTCTALTHVPIGAAVHDYCYVGGQNLGGTKWWDVVYVGGIAGWINEAWLTSNQQTAHCAGGTYMSNSASQPGAGIHTCRSNTCSVQGYANGHSLRDLCVTDGQTLGGTKWWDLVYDTNTGALGWTNEAWLSNQSQILAC